jgi:hypothetical protein
VKKLFLFLLPVSFILLSTQGCYYDKEELLYASSPCDTTSVSYSQTIKPLVNSYCLTCHGGNVYNVLGGSVNLDGYSNLVLQVQNGKLLPSIQHAPGADPMPKNQQKLSDCHITQIIIWLENGAPNN